MHNAFVDFTDEGFEPYVAFVAFATLCCRAQQLKTEEHAVSINHDLTKMR